jgi:hypothetical protein
MSGVLCLAFLQAHSWFFILFSKVVVLSPAHLPSNSSPLCARRRRPLNCGYVSRVRRYTGIILAHFDISQHILPQVFMDAFTQTPTTNVIITQFFITLTYDIHSL